MKNRDRGYVALEFIFTMGLLVLPTALLLLQIPKLIEQKDRVNAIAFEVSNYCANIAEIDDDINASVITIAQSELSASSVLKKYNIIEAKCDYENGEITAGDKVISRVVVEIDAPLVPGLPFERTLNLSSTQQAIVPKYRSL